MFGNIIQLLISIGIIIAGLSGEFALRGTDSSEALVVFGFAWLIYDIYRIVAASRQKAKLEELPAKISEHQKDSALDTPVNITLTREKNFVGSLVNYPIYLNGAEVGTLKNGGEVTAQSSYSKNAISSPTLPNVLWLDSGANSEVKLRFLRTANSKKQNFEIVSGAEEIEAQ